MTIRAIRLRPRNHRCEIMPVVGITCSTTGNVGSSMRSWFRWIKEMTN